MFRKTIVVGFVSICVGAGVVWMAQARSMQAAAPVFDHAFNQQWRDGKAELAGYELTYPRYGQLRQGTAVTIFVTEPFSKRDRIKPEFGKRPAGDEFGVIKLNLIEDFATGIYDYNLMTSVFVGTEDFNGRGPGATSKVSFTAQEWCGHAYHHLLFDGSKIRDTWHSYFDGEGDGRREIDHRADSISEDTLFHWARGLAAPTLAPGQSMQVSVLRSLAVSRLLHIPVEWENATLKRETGTKKITVPAGEFEVYTCTVQIDPMTTTRLYGNRKVRTSGRTWTFHVEAAAPHRIIHWSRTDGYEGKLTGSTRTAYWSQNGNGSEKLLAKLGLKPRDKRMP